jgi:hypothetical protein
MSIEYINIFNLRPSKIYPNWDFWFDKSHLATLWSKAKASTNKRLEVKATQERVLLCG